MSGGSRWTENKAHFGFSKTGYFVRGESSPGFESNAFFVALGVDELFTNERTGGFADRTRTASLSDEGESEEVLVSEDDEDDEDEDDEDNDVVEVESESELDSLSLSFSASPIFRAIFL